MKTEELIKRMQSENDKPKSAPVPGEYQRRYRDYEDAWRRMEERRLQYEEEYERQRRKELLTLAIAFSVMILMFSVLLIWLLIRLTTV